MVKKAIRPIYIAICMSVITLLFVFEAVQSKHLSYHFSFVGYGGTFKNHNLSIIGIPVYWFMLLCGFVITFFVSWYRKEKYKIGKVGAILYPVVFLVIAYTGAKILYIIENYDSFLRNGIELSGVSLYGAIYAVLVLTPVIALITKKKISVLMDFFTPFGIILLACVRTGCFMNGCCGAKIIWRGATPIILPVQLMEVVCDLVILEICFGMEKKSETKEQFAGILYPVFMILYGVCRFFLEMLRKNEVKIAGLTEGQILSIASVLIAGGIILGKKKYFNKEKKNYLKKGKKKGKKK